jgi:hypothetical protein
MWRVWRDISTYSQPWRYTEANCELHDSDTLSPGKLLGASIELEAEWRWRRCGTFGDEKKLFCSGRKSNQDSSVAQPTV